MVFSDSVQLHFYNQRIIISWSWMKSFLHLSTLQKVVAWKLNVISFIGCPKSLCQNTLTIRVVVQQVEKPSTVELQQTLCIAYTIRKIRVPVLEITGDVSQKLKVSPYPIIIADESLKTHIWVGLHTFARADTYVIFNQNNTIYTSLFRYTSKMQYWTSIVIFYYLVSIQPKEVSSPHGTFNMVIRRQTILNVWAQPFL